MEKVGAGGEVIWNGKMRARTRKMLRALGRIKTEEGSFFSIFSWTEADFGDPVVETAVATFGAKFTNGLARQLTRWHKKMKMDRPETEIPFSKLNCAPSRKRKNDGIHKCP